MFWGDFDMLLIDMPPGAGDIAISIAQLLPSPQIPIVMTSQVATAGVAGGAGSIASQTQQRVIGAVENISYLPQPDGFRLELFGSDGDASVSARLSAQPDYETPLLVRVSLDIALYEDGDVGHPVTLDGGPASQVLNGLAGRLPIAERGPSGRPLGAFLVRK